MYTVEVMNMKKQLVSFTVPQATFLEVEATRLGISVAELVRRTVDWFRDTYPQMGSTDTAKQEAK